MRKSYKDISLFTGNAVAHNGDEVASSDREEMPGGDGVQMRSSKLLEPHDSMEFESKEDAFRFYKEYALSIGFSTIIKTSRRSRISGKFIDAKFVCTSYGSKRGLSLSESPDITDASTSVKKKRGRINRSISKTDCKACMHVKRRQDGRWIISSFIREHNHDVAPNQAGHRNKDLCQNNIYSLNDARARKKRMCVPMSQTSGQLQNNEFKERTSSRSSGSHLGFAEGDAQVMFEYVSRMQDENPNFLYAIDLNTEQHLKNLFWADAKGRIDYKNFGDVVLFDTMYKKNEFKFPFAPFIGMNNHFQLLLFGCTFVADETKSTYIWLMRAWLRAMHGQAPKVILTDQDQTLKEAIAEVLPESRHCFCLWHIMGKIQEKLCYVISQHENFITKFCKCILKSQTELQFEKRWWKLVDRFGLRHDVWIQSLYDDRHRWVPMFMNDIFLAGLSAAARLESIVSLLDKCLLRKTSLREFLHQYDTMLQEKCEDEAKADFDAWHKQPWLKSPSPYGKQMATIYTHAVFKKFQVEVLGVVACHPKIESTNDGAATFKVQDLNDTQEYKVTWNEKTTDTSCTCRLFEYNGFLCRHVMIVLQIYGVNTIPAKYILKRWTKDAKMRETLRQGDSIESRNQRYNDLCQRACKLGDEGSLSQESYSIAFTALEEALRKCTSINIPIHDILGSNSPSNDGLHKFEEVTRGMCTSMSKKENDISRREMVPEEATTIGVHCWDQMGPSALQGYLNLRASALNPSYGSQESVQDMGVPTLAGFCGNPEITRGVDRLKRFAPSREDCCSIQPHIKGHLNSAAPLDDTHPLSTKIASSGEIAFQSTKCSELLAEPG